MTDSQKFTSDIAWVAVPGILISLTGLVTLPALTRSFPVDVFGIWVQISVTVGLLTPIITLHLGTAMVRFLAGEEDKDKRRQAFGVMVSSVLTFACFILFTALLLSQELSVFLFADAKYAHFIPLVFLWILTGALFVLSISYLRARGNIKKLSVIQVANTVVRMALIVTLAIAGYSIELIILCIIITEALFLSLVFGMIVNEVGIPHPSFQGIKSYLSFSVPMIPSGVLFWVINSSDRFFITHILSISEAGMYSVSHTLGSLISLFWMPIGFVLFPMVSKLWEQKEVSKVRNYFEYSTKLFLTLAIPAAVGIYILSQPLIAILATPEFMVGGGLVFLIALSTVLLGLWQINAYIILLVEKTKWFPLIIGIAAITNAGINIVLIPKVGIIGAAISTIVSYFMLSAIGTVWARRAISYKIDFRFLSKVVVATLVMALCLRFIEIGSALSIVLAVIAGAAIFGFVLFLSRTFSREDRRLIREALAGLNPRFWGRAYLNKQNPPVGNGRESNEQKDNKSGFKSNGK
ncbi:flippase [Dehalococcoidia bacterium]|nr:flippase [Dehalococcoidia bacterium]